MKGPITLTPSDLPSLATLVDTVFMEGNAGRMARMFPALFNEGNCPNLIGFVDNGRVVSHLGTTRRWASLGGSLVCVACVGAVATYEEYRGRRLASILLQTACERAAADGVDFMLISGGLGLYRRVGAADFGRDWRITLKTETTKLLALSGITLNPMTVDDIPFCATAYAQKMAHFVRPNEDWHYALQSRSCMAKDVDLFVARNRDIPVAYFVCHKPKDDDNVFIIEHAGSPDAIGAAVKSVLDRYEALGAMFHVQGSDIALRRLFESRGARCEQDASNGTLLLLNVPQLVTRMRPYFESVIGTDAAAKLFVEQDGDQFTFQIGNTFALADSKVAAAQILFGDWDRLPLDGLLGQAFPLPSLWYGLNYV